MALHNRVVSTGDQAAASRCLRCGAAMIAWWRATIWYASRSSIAALLTFVLVGSQTSACSSGLDCEPAERRHLREDLTAADLCRMNGHVFIWPREVVSQEEVLELLEPLGAEIARSEPQDGSCYIVKIDPTQHCCYEVHQHLEQASPIEFSTHLPRPEAPWSCETFWDHL